MAEYIEREAVKAKAMTGWVYLGYEDDVVTVDDIDSIPAPDVVEVVRCKDCKHYHLGTAYCDKHSYFVDSDGVSCSPTESPNWTMWDADDYCSDGERRDDHEV